MGPAVIAEIFNRIAEILITIGIPSKVAKAEIQTHPVIAEAKIRNYSIYFKIVKTFFVLLTYQFIFP